MCMCVWVTIKLPWNSCLHNQFSWDHNPRSEFSLWFIYRVNGWIRRGEATAQNDEQGRRTVITWLCAMTPWNCPLSISRLLSCHLSLNHPRLPAPYLCQWWFGSSCCTVAPAQAGFAKLWHWAFASDEVKADIGRWLAGNGEVQKKGVWVWALIIYVRFCSLFFFLLPLANADGRSRKNNCMWTKGTLSAIPPLKALKYVQSLFIES